MDVAYHSLGFRHGPKLSVAFGKESSRGESSRGDSEVSRVGELGDRKPATRCAGLQTFRIVC